MANPSLRLWLCCAVLCCTERTYNIKIAVWKVMNQFNHSQITDIDKFHHIDHIDRSKISFNSMEQRARLSLVFFVQPFFSELRSKECNSLTIQIANEEFKSTLASNTSYHETAFEFMTLPWSIWLPLLLLHRDQNGEWCRDSAQIKPIIYADQCEKYKMQNIYYFLFMNK